MFGWCWNSSSFCIDSRYIALLFLCLLFLCLVLPSGIKINLFQDLLQSFVVYFCVFNSLIN